MSPPPVYLLDDERARTFEPFALTRPVATLAAGAVPLHARWARALGTDIAGIIAADHLADFSEAGAPAIHAGAISAGAIVANARFAPRGDADSSAMRKALMQGAVVTGDGRVAAARLSRDMDAAAFAAGSTSLANLATDARDARHDVPGWWMNEVWDLIGQLPEMLADDVARACASSHAASLPAGTAVVGDQPIVVEAGVTVEPQVVFDTTAGPIYVESGAHLHAFTKLIGPCWIARSAVVLGGEIRGCAIGPWSKVRGEMSSTIVLGFSNKSHDGFVGHSYLGCWVNLGAGTITSNLKNTYGPVSLWTPSGTRDSGLQFLGTLFGDHVKTGIGLRLTTGCVLGAGANVYGSMPPKAVAPFAWGDANPYGTYRLEKFLETAERAMSRRKVALDDRGRRHLTAAYSARWTP